MATGKIVDRVLGDVVRHHDQDLDPTEEDSTGTKLTRRIWIREEQRFVFY